MMPQTDIKSKSMNRRQNRRAPYRAEEETVGTARHDVNDWFRHRGEDFWYSVWKRIECDQPRRGGGRRMRDKSPEAPRDYVVDSETRA
jgi:hypothetical protein